MRKTTSARSRPPGGRSVALALSLCLVWSGVARAEAGPAETAGLAAAVADGSLPPIAERLPVLPRVMPIHSACPTDQLGGTLRMLGGSAKDTRTLPVFGYSRLVGYDTGFEIVPDIAASVDVEQGRVFTFHLRPGMRWSDGAPFTAEDFRYFWEDMAKNPAIAKFGVPVELLVDGDEPEVSFPGPYEVRYAWRRPNPNFLAALAAATPLEIFRPAHYLKAYHERYQDPAVLEATVK